MLMTVLNVSGFINKLFGRQILLCFLTEKCQISQKQPSEVTRNYQKLSVSQFFSQRASYDKEMDTRSIHIFNLLNVRTGNYIHMYLEMVSLPNSLYDIIWYLRALILQLDGLDFNLSFITNHVCDLQQVIESLLPCFLIIK